MQETDHDYFTRRAREEHAAAGRAACEEARESHAQLARRYSNVAAALDAAGDDAGDGARRAIISRVSIYAERKAETSTSPATASPALAVPPVKPAPDAHPPLIRGRQPSGGDIPGGARWRNMIR